MVVLLSTEHLHVLFSDTQNPKISIFQLCIRINNEVKSAHLKDDIKRYRGTLNYVSYTELVRIVKIFL